MVLEFQLRLARLAVFIFAVAVSAHAGGAEPELHVRSGLPHLAALVHAGSGELRVAYLGGSITAAANGWRTLTTEHLRATYPKLTVTEIDAGLPGTGSDLGACRLVRDVLRHRPNLIFIEFAVNDATMAPGRVERTMEGIVRQVRSTAPDTDLCFVYTISTPGLPDLEAGQFQSSARAMENVAAHYGIPSIHFGLEVARRLAAGSLIFKMPAASSDDRTFSHDGVHPTAVGHRVYFSVVERTLPTLLAGRDVVPLSLPKPLYADNWERASLRLVEQLGRRGDWSEVGKDDPNLRGTIKALLPPTWRAATPGAEMEFEFRGRVFGLLGIAAPDSGEFRVTVDDLPPVTATFFDAFVSPTFCRERDWFYPRELGDALHHVTVELIGTTIDKAAIKEKSRDSLEPASAYAAHRLTLCGALVVESLAP